MGTFKLDDIRQIAGSASRRARYPLRSSDDLVQALGGRDATINYEGRGHKAAEAAQIPGAVFPIESEEDLIATLASLRARGGDQAEGMPRGEELKDLPPDAGRPREIPEGERLPRGKVGAKGWR